MGKRLIKSARLHFVDSGLACRLLGIRKSSELITHPLRGQIFETWVASELYKQWMHRYVGAPPLSHLRTQKAREANTVVSLSGRAIVADAKSAQTPTGRWLDALATLAGVVERAPDVSSAERWVIHGGERSQPRTTGQLIAWCCDVAVPMASRTRSQNGWTGGCGSTPPMLLGQRA